MTEDERKLLLAVSEHVARLEIGIFTVDTGQCCAKLVKRCSKHAQWHALIGELLQAIEKVQDAEKKNSNIIVPNVPNAGSTSV